MQNQIELDKLFELLAETNITDFEVIDKAFGYHQSFGLLPKTIIIYGRFIHDPKPFNALGFGVILRDSR